MNKEASIFWQWKVKFDFLVNQKNLQDTRKKLNLKKKKRKYIKFYSLYKFVKL